MKFNRTSLLKLLSVIAVFLVAQTALGQDTEGIGKIAENITTSFKQIGQLMIAISYVSGIGFMIASIFKFKQHKDNPTQIPLGTPIALLAIAIALVFLPAFIKPAGTTLLGSDPSGSAGGFTGKGVRALPSPDETTDD